MIYIGTSGYSYDDWVGPFYPQGLDKKDWLGFYAGEFQATEINFTYYRMPNARTLQAMANKVPDGFVFTVKTPQELTHIREDVKGLFPQFTTALQPLIDQGKFGCVLAQFPHSFHNTSENQNYLRQFGERMGDLPVVVEFRGRDWLTDEVFDLLRRQQLGFCCVDEPRLKGLMPPIAVATSPVAYVRFHGRNARKWWQHEQAWERYDYTYTEDELREWAPKIHNLAQEVEKVFTFANNHWQGQAVGTARQLKLLLSESG
jgi:uncharacterized protein YecE (DUF72 family)